MQKTIHIGNEIRKVLKTQQRSIALLADEINCDQSNLCKQLAHQHLHSELLYQISAALGKDFFIIYSQSLSKVITDGK